MYIRYAPNRGSYHIIRTWTRVPNVALTLCGKRATGPSADTFGGEATCESCWRLMAKAVQS